MNVPFALARLLARLGLGRYLPAARRLPPGAADFLPYYSARLLAAPLDGLVGAASALGPAAPGVIDLAQPSPRFDLVPSGSTKLPADRRGCPPPAGLPELRELIAGRHRADGGSPVGPEGVRVTAGATGALAAAADAFLDPGSVAVVFDPGPPLFDLALRSRRAAVRRLPTWCEDGRTRFDPQRLARAMRGARLLLVADPDNPTGGTLAAEDRELIAWHANKYDVLIYVDSSFGRFRYGGGPAPGLDSFPGAARRVLTAGSLTQGWGLAAARVGWVAGHRHLVAACGVASALSGALVPTVGQQTAVAALRQGDGPFGPVRADFAARRRYVLERLGGAGLRPVPPAGGYFVWLPVAASGLTGEAFAHELLADRGVRVTPGSAFGPSGRGHVRLSFAADDGRVREGLARLAAFLGGRGPAAAPAEAVGAA